MSTIPYCDICDIKFSSFNDKTVHDRANHNDNIEKIRRDIASLDGKRKQKASYIEICVQLGINYRKNWSINKFKDVINSELNIIEYTRNKLNEDTHEDDVYEDTTSTDIASNHDNNDEVKINPSESKDGDIQNREDLKSIVATMRSAGDDTERIYSIPTLLERCIICRYTVKPQKWGPILERSLMDSFDLTRSTSSNEGDCTSRNGSKIEIKVSLGASNGSANFVQIRPDHNIDYYLLMVYDMYANNIGELYLILMKSDEMYALLPKYGTYAHGTNGELDKISADNIKGRNREYALRPRILPSRKQNKYVALWKKMIEFKKTHDEIARIFND